MGILLREESPRRRQHQGAASPANTDSPDRHTLSVLAEAPVLGAGSGSSCVVAIGFPIPLILVPARKRDREHHRRATSRSRSLFRKGERGPPLALLEQTLGALSTSSQ